MTGFKDYYKKELYNQLEEIPESILSKYAFVECIQTTTNSMPYRIEHKVLKVNYVLKIYKSIHQANEYKILSQYIHPGIPRIYDVLIEQGKTFVILEYFQGNTLDKMIKKRPEFNEKKLANILLQMCEILSFLHEKSPAIIHKDLKPENVIIDINDRVKLIDFGSARCVKENQSRDTVLLGTHGYAAPEQYGFKQTDQRTDIYALGVMVDEIAQNFEMKLSKEFNRIVSKCKEIDPDNRFSNVREIAYAVQDSNRPIYRKKKNLISAIIVIVLICCGILINQNLFTSNVYQFESEVIAEAVSIQLNKAIDSITIDDLNRITEITIWGEKIVENGDNIVWESLPSNYVSAVIIDDVRYTRRGEIDTLEDLENMHNLYTLTLVKQKITDLSPIKNLSIVHLFLNDNAIEDMSSLKDMNSLYTLEVGGNPISDFSVISDLTNLGELDISDTNFTDEMSLLGDYSGIKLLIAKNLNLSNIDFLENSHQLERLNLENNKITDLSTLAKFDRLEYLNIAENPIDDISIINGMTNLKYVVLRNTLINEKKLNKKIQLLQD